MRLFLSAALSALALCALAPTAPAQAQQATVKMGYIDSNRIIQAAPGAQEAQRAMQQEIARAQAELEGLEADLKKALEDYEKQQVTLSPDAKRQRQEEIRMKQTAYQQRMAELEQQAGARQQELVEPIMGRINRVLGEIREAEGYAFIFDVAGGAVVAADPALDLTEQVLTRLRALAQSDGQGQTPGR